MPRPTQQTVALSRGASLADIRRREWLLQMLALTAAGCAPREAIERDATLTIAYPLDEWTYRFTDDATQFLVFLPLVARNARGELQGRLAERWEHSSDYRTWRVHLRRGVRWHDGVPVTAHDVKFTLDLLSSPERRSRSSRGFTR